MVTKSKAKAHKTAVVPTPESTEEKRDTLTKLSNMEPVESIELKSASNTSNIADEELKPIEINETVTIEDIPEQTISRKEAVREMHSDTSVVIDGEETYFERLYAKQQKEPVKEKTFAESMKPEILDTYTDAVATAMVKSKNANKLSPSSPTIANSEVVVDPSELPEGKCQYYISALYIIDSATNVKYLQGTVVTLDENPDNMSKIFKTALMSGRLIRCQDLTKRVEREKQTYDSRSRKWLKEGTPEYDEYMKYMQEKQNKIEAANERKIQQERKRLGIE